MPVPVSFDGPFAHHRLPAAAMMVSLLAISTAAPVFASVRQAVPDDASTFGVESPAYIVIRSVLFVALLLVIGVGVFRQMTLGTVRRRGTRAGLAVAELAARRANVLAIAGSIVLLGSVVARLIAQLYTTADLTEGVTRSLATTLLFETAWGWGWLLQLGATVLVLACYLVIHRTGRGAAGLAIATLLLAVTPMMSGHAMAEERFTALTVFAGTMHVLGASGWLGTLTTIMLVGVPAARQLDPADRGPAVAELISAFSPAALACGALVLVTGTFVAWVHLGTGPALWRSEYGRLLLMKLGALGLVAGIGAYNWRVVGPALGTERATLQLRRHATLELLLAVVVVVLTGALVATPLPGAHDLVIR